MRLRRWWSPSALQLRRAPPTVWPAAVDTAGLAVVLTRHDLQPAVVTVISTLLVDRVRLRMLPGQIRRGRCRLGGLRWSEPAGLRVRRANLLRRRIEVVEGLIEMHDLTRTSKRLFDRRRE